MGDVQPCVVSYHPSQESSDSSEFLSVVSPKDKPWDVHRLQADQVTEILADGLPHHQRQAERMRQCATHLNFGWVIESVETGEIRLRLKEARFCRIRYCPICQWRRSKMWVARFYRAFPKIYADHPDLRYVLLTLTVRNCPVEQLRATIQQMNSAWQRLIQRKVWPAVGFVRSLEVTRSEDESAHPHFHCLLAIPQSYFNGRKYLSTAKWAALWQEALRADYTPICDVRIVKPKQFAKQRSEGLQNVLEPAPVDVLLSSITEVIKYAVKPSDLAADADWLLTIVDQLRNVRAVAVGGLFKQYLSDEEPENLIAEDGFGENLGGVLFGWREQHSRYKRERAVAD